MIFERFEKWPILPHFSTKQSKFKKTTLTARINRKTGESNFISSKIKENQNKKKLTEFAFVESTLLKSGHGETQQGQKDECRFHVGGGSAVGSEMKCVWTRHV